MIDISMLRVGDKIRVVNVWPEGGRQNHYGEMDKYLGKTLTVRETVREFCRVWEDAGEASGIGWAWFPELIDEIVYEEDDEAEPSGLEELRAFLGFKIK